MSRNPCMKDVENDHNQRQMMINNNTSREFFETLFELHQMSKQFKFINEDTKIIFVRNRIPRAVIKSKIKPKASLVTLGGGYYATGTDNLKRLLENLPKKLYDSDHQPSSWDWHDHVIVRLQIFRKQHKDNMKTFLNHDNFIDHKNDDRS